MLFSSDNKIANEKIIFKTRPSMLLGFKKAFIALIILIIILSIASPIIAYIGEMQVYLISYVKVSLTRYVAIAIFTIVFLLLIYIIYQILAWYSIEYILTDYRIISKKGIIYSRKSYIPYSKIQDINSSQSILGKILSIGNIEVYSAYDNNQVKLNNIPKLSKIEEIIFYQMNKIPRETPSYPYRNENNYNSYENNDYLRDNNYITPEPQYEDNLDQNINYALNNFDQQNPQGKKYKLSHPNYGNVEENKNSDNRYEPAENYYSNEDYSIKNQYLEDDYNIEDFSYNKDLENTEFNHNPVKRKFNRFKK